MGRHAEDPCPRKILGSRPSESERTDVVVRVGHLGSCSLPLLFVHSFPEHHNVSFFQYQSQLQMQTSGSDFGGLHLSRGTIVMYATPPLLASLYAQYLATRQAGLEYNWGKSALPLLPYFTAPSNPFTACSLTCKQLLLYTSSVCRASGKVPKICAPLPYHETFSAPPTHKRARCYLQ